jgi:hypothetical protein
MSVDLKAVIRQEYIKCAQDPVHFMKKYCYIQHPQRGRVLFHLYPFQEKVLYHFQKNPYSIVLKSRQLGLSTLAAAHALWLMLFHKDKNVLTLATTQATARNLVSKVLFMYDNLPSWLKVETEEKNKLSLRLSNGSKITAKSSNSDAARSEAVSLLIVDEAAFIDNISETWASAQQTLATGGGALILSTPNGVGNWFHQTWVKAEAKENEFLPIRLPWDVHPERDLTWRQAQDTLLGDLRLAAQECDCSFTNSGDGVFYADQLEYLEENYITEPVERRGLDRNLWIWDSVDYSRTYMICADVSRGDGKDFSAFHVIDLESNTQVAEYKGQIGTTEFGHLLVGIASEYNGALLVVENANMGWSTIQTIIERNYDNLYYSPRSGNITPESYFNQYDIDSNMVPGFSNTPKTRPLVTGKLQEYVTTKSVVIKSKRLLEEMKVFIWKNGRAEALSGYNDDLVMSIAIGMYIRDTALRYKTFGLDAARRALENMTTSRSDIQAVYTAGFNTNPYEIQNPHGGSEDISWILKG